MGSGEVLMGIMALICGLGAIVATFFSSAGGDGLSAIMGGSEMQAKKKENAAGKVIERYIIMSAVFLGIFVLMIDVYIAHV